MRAALIALSVLMALAGVAAAYVLLRDDPPTCAGWSRQGTVPVGGPQTAASALAEHLNGPEGDDAPTKGLAAGDFVQVERTDGRVDLPDARGRSRRRGGGRPDGERLVDQRRQQLQELCDGWAVHVEPAAPVLGAQDAGAASRSRPAGSRCWGSIPTSGAARSAAGWRRRCWRTSGSGAPTACARWSTRRRADIRRFFASLGFAPSTLRPFVKAL